jgi:hypothetical protein
MHTCLPVRRPAPPQTRLCGLSLLEVQQFDRHKKSVVAAIKALGSMVRLVARRTDADKLEEELELKVAAALIKRYWGGAVWHSDHAFHSKSFACSQEQGDREHMLVDVRVVPLDYCFPSVDWMHFPPFVASHSHHGHAAMWYRRC